MSLTVSTIVIMEEQRKSEYSSYATTVDDSYSYQVCYDRGPADGMEMDVCAAYRHVTTTQSPPLFPAEKLYDNL